MLLLQHVRKYDLASVVLPALATLILAGVCGCGRDQQPAPSGGPPAVSSQDTTESVPPDKQDGGSKEPKQDAASLQARPSGVGSPKDNTLVASAKQERPDESPQQSENTPSVPRAKASQGVPEDANLSPVDALKALGATVKMNAAGDVIGVDLKDTEVTDADLTLLKEMTKIKTLNLSQTRVTDEGLSNLEGLTGLKYLYLFGTDTTDTGLKHLSGLQAMEVLCLDDTRITDAGLVHLKNMTELVKLHIQSKDTITDAGLELLTGLTGLTELRVGGTEVTDEGVDELKKSLPDCQVVR